MFKLSKITIFLLCFSISLFGQNRVSINIPNSDDEAKYIWQTIKDISFFEKNNYQVILPKGKLIDELIEKSKLNKLTDLDFQKLKEYFTIEVYRKKDYLAGYQKIKEKEELLNSIIQNISKHITTWKFTEFEKYQINLTLYGPGGSYNPENGTILIYTTKDGMFKQYLDPSNTIIHEIVHIGIQESLISKYNIHHKLKERIVDLYVKINFGEKLPDYKLQTFGDNRLDNFLITVESFDKIERVIKNLTDSKSKQ